MPIHEEYADVLQCLEVAVISLFRENPEMTDYTALTAYETAYARYRAERRGHVPKPPTLTGLDQIVYDALCTTCEWRLGRTPDARAAALPVKPITAAEIETCLRRLTGSVKMHTARAGRQGYLNFVSHFAP